MSPLYSWLILAAFLLIVEIFTPGFFAGSIGLAAIVTYLVSLVIPMTDFMQWIVFFIANFLILALVRKYILKLFYKNKPQKETNFQSLLGHETIVVETIDNDAGEGYVKVYGDMWRAFSESGEKIKKGEKIVVSRVEGNKVFVKKID